MFRVLGQIVVVAVGYWVGKATYEGACKVTSTVIEKVKEGRSKAAPTEEKQAV